jgi:hypothetical protein
MIFRIPRFFVEILKKYKHLYFEPGVHIVELLLIQQIFVEIYFVLI